ncbi:MAG: portal protein, partial [bacterium]
MSELTKIAIIHLYVQGFTDEDLIDFELSLTNPSIVYEQEKLNLWKEKIGVAESIMNSKMLSQEWIYHNILELSDDEIVEERTKIAEDVKRMAQLEQSAQPQQPGATGEQPATDEAPPTEEEEQQVSDVDSILASLEDGGEESELEGYGDE